MVGRLLSTVNATTSDLYACKKLILQTNKTHIYLQQPLRSSFNITNKSCQCDIKVEYILKNKQRWPCGQDLRLLGKLHCRPVALFLCSSYHLQGVMNWNHTWSFGGNSCARLQPPPRYPHPPAGLPTHSKAEGLLSHISLYFVLAIQQGQANEGAV